MGSRRHGLKVLLDTSFLLPSLGVDVGPDVVKGLGELTENGAEIYFSHLSMLESLWVMARLMREGTFNGNRFSQGLRSIVNGGSYKLLAEDAYSYIEGLRLYGLGHKDMIDNILYASSVNRGINFMTMDRELKQFIEERGLKDNLMFP